MKRLLFALAGYALYRWWTTRDAEPATQPAPVRRTPRSRPAQPT